MFGFFFKQKFYHLFLLIPLLFTGLACADLAIIEENLQKVAQTSQNTEDNTSQTSDVIAANSPPSQDSEEKASQTPPQKIKKTSSEYVNLLLPEARRIEKEYGIPLDLTIAIAREESGNGDYIIGQGNHFGLRCASDDCITLEKNGRQISYETCPDTSECFNIFAKSVKELTGDKEITIRRLYRNGYATSPQWVKKVRTIRKEVRRTLSQAGVKY